MDYSVENVTDVIYTIATQTYQLRYEWDYVEEIKTALPVYTGHIKANGKIATSRTLKHISNVTRRHTGESIIEVSKADGKAICRQLRAAGLVSHTEQFSENDKVVRVVLKIRKVAK